MADTASSPAPSNPTDSPAESKAQRDARLRRERRNAKIQSEGSSRLSKITSLSGRPQAAEAELQRTPPTRGGTNQSPHRKPQTQNDSARPQASGGAETPDPDEVDISSMFQRPTNGGEGMPDQQEMFRRILRASGDNQQQQQGGEEEDPMMRMVQQMMGGMSGEGGEMPNGLPPGLANIFNPQQDAAQGGQAQAGNADYIWRIVHSLTALLIALYAVTTLSFTGSSLSRSEYVSDPVGPRLFYLFATAEVVLQTTRYFIDKGRLPPSGLLGKIVQFLPEPWAGYVRVVNRYGVMYTTVVSDALLVVFVLGVVAWWGGSAGR